MPERESASPRHDADARLGDLFENLPAPAQHIPQPDSAPPAPGSRRAAREAAAQASAASDSAPLRAGAEAPLVQPAPASAPSASEERATVAPPAAADPVTPAPAEPRIADSRPVASPPGSPADPEHAGGLHDLFGGHHDDHEDHAKPKKKRRRGCLIALIVVLAILGGIAGAGVWVWNTYSEKISDIMGWGPPADWEPGLATGEVLVTIHEGDTGGPVSTALFEAGVTRTEDVFYDYLVEENIAVTFYPGIYRLQEKMTAEAALEAIKNPENKMENSVSVGEGATISSSLPEMAEVLGLPLEDFEAAVADPSAYGVTAQSLEGWLFPAVYTFDPGVTATQVIQRMVDRTRESLQAAGVSAGDEQRVLTIASIIQREGHTADFDKVSRVIQNRLAPDNSETHGLLQMDSTAQYGYGLSHEGPVASWDWDAVVGDKNAWNTYVNAGIPVGPISNPSAAAIEAAMNPADGPWFYFVTVNLDTGETVFSATYAEQQAAEAQYRKWCEENPDGGCY